MLSQNHLLPDELEFTAELLLALFDAAAEAARLAARRRRKALNGQRARGRTLRPGSGTPVWNELLRQMDPLLLRRGTKVRLARWLGLPRQRMQDCLKTRTALLDGERTLRLLCWVAGQQRRRELAV